MPEYHSKLFTIQAGVDNEVESWLNSFTDKSKPNALNGSASIEMYTQYESYLLVTISRYAD